MRRRTERVYCLALGKAGKWLLLNRDYKPYGQGMTGWVVYSHCPGIRLFLRPADLKKLDGGAQPYRPGDQRLWLYHDATRPERGPWFMNAYLQRLAVLDLGVEEVA